MDVIEKAREPHMSEVNEADVRARVVQLLAEHADDDMTTFLGAQFDPGLARMDYPLGLGGLDASPKLQEIVDEALERAGRNYPWIRNAMGIGMCGPTSSRAAPRSSGSGFSARSSRPRRSGASSSASRVPARTSPGSPPGPCATATSGSSTARRSGPRSAHLSASACCWPAPTPDAPKHKGLRMFIVDMHQPGVEVRPIRSIAGASGFNEVFFTDARAPTRGGSARSATAGPSPTPR